MSEYITQVSEMNDRSVTRERREDLGIPSSKLPALYTKLCI